MNTNEIINKYKEIYPDVEAVISASSALYTKGIEDLERLYDEWNITGNEKAQLLAAYVSGSVKTMIDGAMQVSLGLLDKAYTIPLQAQSIEGEIKVKEAEVKFKDSEIKLKEAGIKLKEAEIKLKEADTKVKNADTAYREAQTKVLQSSENLNAMIKVFQSILDMYGTLGASDVETPRAFIATSKEAILKVLTVLEKPDGSRIFTDQEIQTLRNM